MSDELELGGLLRDHYERSDPGPVPARLTVATERLAGARLPRAARASRWAALLTAALAIVVVTAAVLVGSPRDRAGAVAPSASASVAPASVAPADAPTEAPATPGVDADGIPTAIDGEPVLRGGAIADRVARATDDRSFLVAGWLGYVIADCFVPDDFPDSPLIVPCFDGHMLRDGPVERGGSWPWGIRVVVGRQILLPGGPFVLRVHVHDPRAADCPPAYRLPCEEAIVVEAKVWRGDL